MDSEPAAVPEDPGTITARIDALESRLENRADPVWLSILTAPLDDELYTEEQQRRDAEANAAIERGEGIPHEEILREFGLNE
jgi:hypothetical protein